MSLAIGLGETDATRHLKLIKIIFIDQRHGQAKLGRGTQISTVASEKIAKTVKNCEKGTKGRSGGVRS